MSYILTTETGCKARIRSASLRQVVPHNIDCIRVITNQGPLPFSEALSLMKYGINVAGVEVW